MKSDLTCPVEITGVEIRRENEQDAENGQIVCLIDFLNLAAREVSSIQMNIICYDQDDRRLGGRLVRASVFGEPKGAFTGSFMPEHVDGTARVESSVEKVWYSDGVMWRRDERNVREYDANLLPEGRELDRLRAVAGPDARGYARQDDTVWMCVCGRANRTSEDVCMRCGRERAYVMEMYSFDAVDETQGRKERIREQKTREAVQRSSAQSAWQADQQRKKRRKKRRRVTAVIALLAIAAAGLAGWRWGAPAALCMLADRKMAEGKAADAKALYDEVSARWPDMADAAEKSAAAETVIIDRLISEGTKETLTQAAERAEAAGDTTRQREARLALARVLDEAGDRASAEALLRKMAGDREAETMLCDLVYRIAAGAKEKLDYETAIERFASLGAYTDAEAQRKECVYLYGRQLMREGKFEEACEKFETVTDYEDTVSLLRSTRYALAAKLHTRGEKIRAAQLYESLGMYEDAAERAKACRYEAGCEAVADGNTELAAEQLALAEDYEDAQQLFRENVRSLADAALEAEDWQTAIGWLAQLPREAAVLADLNRAVYAWAEQLEREGQREEAAVEFASLGDYGDARARANALEYTLATEEMEVSPEDALARFEGLGSYEDAPKKAQACRIAWAQRLQAEGEYERALAVWEQLGGAEDAEEQIRRCRYALAQERFDEGDFAGAAQLYEACGAYLDAEEGVMRARYAAAAALEEAGSFREAAAAFAALGSYSDARQAQSRCEDEWLRGPWTEAQLDTDLGNYNGVILALEDLWQEKLPSRYADIPKLYEEACLGLAQELIGLDRPLEALPILERIPDNKTAKKRLNDYVFRIIGRWKETRGTEFVFRRDGTCRIAGTERYFGGKGYEIDVGDEPYPTTAAYSVVSLRGSTLTIKDRASGKTLRLTYLGLPDAKESAGEKPAEEET